jgi:hypothetical protein
MLAMPSMLATPGLELLESERATKPGESGRESAAVVSAMGLTCTGAKGSGVCAKDNGAAERSRASAADMIFALSTVLDLNAPEG